MLTRYIIHQIKHNVNFVHTTGWSTRSMREEREETLGQNNTAIFSRLDPLFALSTNGLKALKYNCLIKAGFMLTYMVYLTRRVVLWHFSQRHPSWYLEAGRSTHVGRSDRRLLSPKGHSISDLARSSSAVAWTWWDKKTIMHAQIYNTKCHTFRTRFWRKRTKSLFPSADLIFSWNKMCFICTNPITDIGAML